MSTHINMLLILVINKDETKHKAKATFRAKTKEYE